MQQNIKLIPPTTKPHRYYLVVRSENALRVPGWVSERSGAAAKHLWLNYRDSDDLQALQEEAQQIALVRDEYVLTTYAISTAGLGNLLPNDEQVISCRRGPSRLERYQKLRRITLKMPPRYLEYIRVLSLRAPNSLSDAERRTLKVALNHLREAIK